MVEVFAQIDNDIEYMDGQIGNGLDYFEQMIDEAIHGRTSIPREYYATFAVDSILNRLFPMIMPADLLLMAYLFITFRWKKANTLRKSYKVCRVVNRLRLTDSDIQSAVYIFQTRINELSKEDDNEDNKNNKQAE